MFCLVVAEKVAINLVLQLADFNNPLTSESHRHQPTRDKILTAFSTTVKTIMKVLLIPLRTSGGG